MVETLLLIVEGLYAYGFKRIDDIIDITLFFIGTHKKVMNKKDFIRTLNENNIICTSSN